MLRTRPLTITLATLLTCIMFSACKKVEEPPLPPSRPKPVAKKPAPKQLTSAEIKSLAKQRFLVAKRKIEPFDKKAGLRDLVYETYKIDLTKVFPDDTYDLSTLKDVDDVASILGDRAAAAIEPDFSDERRTEMQKDVLTRFPYYNVNDSVTAVIKRPDGSTFEKKGKLISVSPKAVTVGGTRILYQDLLKPAKWAFYKDQVEKKRTTYIYNLFTLPKGEAKQEKKEELEASVYAEFGCVKKADKWVSLKSLIDTEIQPALDKAEVDYMNEEEKKIQNKVAEDLRKEGLL